MAKKLLLINPRNLFRKGLLKHHFSNFPPLGLGIVARLTPDDWEIEIFDENFEDFEYIEADLVGLTAFTSNVYRAYQIAKVYRENGVPTVMGGVHVSMMTDEALNYIDTVVKGEAESIWPEVIADFEKGSLKRVYEGVRLPADRLVPARHDLFHPNYVTASIQTTRGCPWRCDFCTVHAFNGTAYRQRPVKDILDELEMTMDKEFLFFVDDNLVGYSKKSMARTIELLKGMKARGLKREWFTQASINFAENDEVLQLAHDTGCKLILMGIETEKLEGLEETNKDLNKKIGFGHYDDIFSKIHQYGIAVLGTFIFALDTDTAEDLKKRVDFIINSKVDAYQTSVLTPFPGTGTYRKFVQEDRIHYKNFPEDWQRMRFFENVIDPINMTHDELNDVLYEQWGRLFDRRTILDKFKMTLRETKDPNAAFWALVTNSSYGNTIFEGTNRYFDLSSFLSVVRANSAQ